MDEIGEYHAKWDKPISKNQSTNDLADKQMMTHNGGWEGGKNGEMMEYIEGKEGLEGWGVGKYNNESNIITLCKCMIMQIVCCYSMYKQK